METFIVWIYGWVNNREASDMRRYHAHYDVIVMILENMHTVYVRCVLVGSGRFINILQSYFIGAGAIIRLRQC